MWSLLQTPAQSGVGSSVCSGAHLGGRGLRLQEKPAHLVLTETTGRYLMRRASLVNFSVEQNCL